MSSGATAHDTTIAAISAHAFIRHQIHRSTSTTPRPAPKSRLICHAWLMEVSRVMMPRAITRVSTAAARATHTRARPLGSVPSHARQMNRR